MSQFDVAGIGRRVAAYRRRNNWSAQRLADNTDGAVSRATIANLESGRRASVGLEQFLALSLALRVPPVALLLDLDRPFDAAGIVFPGPAPAPLEVGAPAVAVARWLNAETDSMTTDAARYVAELLAIITRYSAIIDSDAAAHARQRLRGESPAQRTGEITERARLCKQLEGMGVHLPAE